MCSSDLFTMKQSNLTRVAAASSLLLLLAACADMSDEQRRTATALCDVIIPADATSPAASAVGVPDFIDEWISAPYPAQQRDRTVILQGLAWLDAESQRRFQQRFDQLDAAARARIADDIDPGLRGRAVQVWLDGDAMRTAALD